MLTVTGRVVALAGNVLGFGRSYGCVLHDHVAGLAVGHWSNRKRILSLRLRCERCRQVIHTGLAALSRQRKQSVLVCRRRHVRWRQEIAVS